MDSKTQKMVDKFKNLLQRIKTEKGSVTVFAIIKMDEITDKWSVVFSASWVTDGNLTETFNYLRQLLIETLNSEEVTTIARLSVFSNTEHLIELILGSVINVTNGDVILKDTTLNGYKIHEAHIFESNR